MTGILELTRRSLTSTGQAIWALVEKVDVQEGRWKPAPERWSILEVVNHLADEEVEDFRTRVEILATRPDDPFPPIDPQGWVTSRRYADRDLKESLHRFLDERKRSLTWLEGIGSADLDREKVHPAMGAMTARQMLACWAAHDLLHVRQLTKLRYDRLAREIAPRSLDYAGGW